MLKLTRFFRFGNFLLAAWAMLSCSPKEIKVDIIAPAPAPVPAIATFEIEPATVIRGLPVQLRWTVRNAENAVITLEGFGSKPASGYMFVRPQTSQTYTLVILKNGMEVERRSKDLVVNDPPPATPIPEVVNKEEAKYLKGMINFENVENKDELELHINRVDIADFPDKVRLFVTVRDRLGNHVANLAPPYSYDHLAIWKAVFERGSDSTRREIEDWKVEEARSNDMPPTSFALVLDYSGSMAGNIGFLETAVGEALKCIRPGQDDFLVVQFDHRFKFPIPATDDVQAIAKLHSLAELGQATAFYTASSHGLSKLSQSKKSKVAILFTDGEDNASFHTPDDIVNQARKADSRVFALGFGSAQGEILDAIAKQTGGGYYFPDRPEELQQIFQEICLLMKVSYVITYSPTKEGSDIRSAEVAAEFVPGKPRSARQEYYIRPQTIASGQRSIAVFFETAKAAIMPQYHELIQAVADFLKSDPNQKIVVRGHTDSYGSLGANKSLSNRRAKTVHEALLKRGVSPQQIVKIEALGETELIHKDDKTARWKAAENRRVEMDFVQ